MTAHDIDRWRLTLRCTAGFFFALLSQTQIADAATPERRVSFVNDVVPVLTKAGCNAGVCHAKAGGGQNGFQLSLLGFEPQEDFEQIVLQGRGRRLFRSAPEQSLLLMKPTGRIPHGGGIRLHESSEAYALVRRWIQQGALYSDDSERRLVSLEVKPRRGVLRPFGEQQLTSLARYSDGTVRDVTGRALYESNDETMAKVADGGLVTVSDVPGKVAVMVRYQGEVAVYMASVPLGAPIEMLPTARNFIDEFVFDNLQEIGIPPSPVCDDATFIRRVTLDIAGHLPTETQAREFLACEDPEKRDLAIDTLLDSTAYADYFAGKWTALLKNRRDDASDIIANFAFHAWIRDSLLANTPYDQLVREILAATGTVIENPPVAWYKRVQEPNQQMEDVAQLFLGVRMQCAQCHHHPFDRWSQEDYYGLTAFFSRVGRKPTDTRGEDLIFHQRGLAEAVNAKTRQPVKPAALGESVGDIPAEEDPRLRLAEWMSSKANAYFSKALVNRYWKHFFQRGLIEPEDDIRDTNPPTNPALLAALEDYFRNSGFDLKELVRVITSSHAYQLSAIPNECNVADHQNYSRYYPRRLPAEVLLDAIDDLTGASTDFANLPQGTRAVALPDNSYNSSSPFLRVFGRPESRSVCECERSQSPSLVQSLHMINAADIKAKLATSNGRAERLSKANQPDADRINELYWAAFSRPPQETERATALEYLSQHAFDADGNAVDNVTATKHNLQDILWALINTKEFQFNH